MANESRDDPFNDFGPAELEGGVAVGFINEAGVGVDAKVDPKPCVSVVDSCDNKEPSSRVVVVFESIGKATSSSASSNERRLSSSGSKAS